MIGKYFYNRRPIANGIAMAGSPVFLSALSLLNTWLFDQFGWRGSFLILGGLLFNCCVAGSLMRPIGPKPLPAKAEEPKVRRGAGAPHPEQTLPSPLDRPSLAH